MAGANIPVERLLRELSRPDAYPHRVEAVRVAQTHASCVFLTGEFVYKVKKPVDFGFLDYSTPAARRDCCERELRLNWRLSPEVYLDLAPIVEREGRLRVAAEGEPVEWAVRMRQLPETDLLSRRLARGEVEAADLQRVARVLARFHAGADAGPEVRRFGLPEAIARNVEENFTQTATLLGEALPREHLEAVREYARGFLRDREALFLERLRQGRIRDGHGDLRAQNLYVAPGTEADVHVLDCIEFNERFRCGDAAADLAYLAMDLDLAGRPDLRLALVEAYVRESGDTGLGEVLRFYQYYRAVVRGKIALLALQEPEIPAADREEHRATAAAALDLALSYTRPRERPLLLCTVAFSGAGKSVLARALARRLPAVRLASDEVRKELSGVPADTALAAAAYTEARRQAVYAELRRRARPLLQRGVNVILDATFLSPEERRRAAELAADTGAEPVFLHCDCPDPVIRARLAARAGDASDAGLAVYEEQLRAGTGALELPGAKVVTVRTDQAVEQGAAYCVSRIP
ncbi:MAG: AAA family ATPase [Armatimonadota bacterium]